MRYKRTFKIVFFQLLLSSFLAILATGKLEWILGGLYLSALGLAFVKGEDISRRHRGFRHWQVVLLLFVFTVVFLADLLALSGDFVLSVVHVAMAVSVLKLFTANSPRDYFYLFLIAFGFLLIATTIAFDLSFVLYLTWFMVAGILALMLFEIRTSSRLFSKTGAGEAAADEGSADDPLEPATPGRINISARALTTLGLSVYVGIIALAIPTFVILPRLALGLWQLNLANRMAISGFSDTTRLGDISSIKMSEIVVMHVKTNQPTESLPSDLKWKGIALDKYDGRGWRLSNTRKVDLTIRPGGSFHLDRRRDPEQLLLQEFYLEPITSQVLFLAHRQLSISRDALAVAQTFTGTAVSPYIRFQKFKYSGYSDIYRPSPDAIARAPRGYPGWFPATLTETPRRSPRMEDLVRRVTAGIPSPYRQALALRQYLQDNYRYSLEMPLCPPEKDPVEFFLFEMKKGHCEYYASALAILLRYLDIPSCVVNGFQRGEFNTFNRTFVVRQSDAHSWVEAYFEGFGWIELDATPPGPDSGRDGLAAMLADIADSIQFYWFSNVVNYDVGDQIRIFRNMRTRWHEWKHQTSAFFRTLSKKMSLDFLSTLSKVKDLTLRPEGWKYPAIAGVILAAAAFGFAFRRWRKAGRSGRGGVFTRGPVMPAYRKFLKLAARQGYKKPPGETPREFSRRLRDIFPPAVLDEFTSTYYNLRFNPAVPPGMDPARLQRLGQELEIFSRRRKHLLRGNHYQP